MLNPRRMAADTAPRTAPRRPATLRVLPSPRPRPTGTVPPDYSSMSISELCRVVLDGERPPGGRPA